MTERKKDLLAISVLLVLLLACFAKILFTAQIIRAPDIISEFYWGVKDIPTWKFSDLFNFDFSSADWDIYPNSGLTAEGGYRAINLLFYKNLIFYLFPPPASVAWFIVLHLFFGASGVYCYCRAIGASRTAAFFGAMVFAFSPEIASLINAGHVLKISTISFAPWAFYLFEKGFLTRRVVFFLATSVVLALQFFNSHWQIAYYTCLGIGVYGLLRVAGVMAGERRECRPLSIRLVAMCLATMLFFLSSVSVSLLPIANWSKDTNRGVQSGANQGKGGLEREEAMLWSLPPEELTGFVIPGFFGLSRQEGGENPTNVPSYYWGRMTFTQTVSYMGLLPWLLVPLPLIFRRDRYTWLAMAAVVGSILFSMGKFTPFYNLLFDYFPGINRFRVPKMMLFMTVMALAVLSARGLDLLMDRSLRETTAFRRYVYGVISVPLLLAALLGAVYGGRDYWIGQFYEILAQPTRFEQGGHLVGQRWGNLVVETAIAAALSAVIAAIILAWQRRKLAAGIVVPLLLGLYLADVGRINDKFMFLVKVPDHVRGVRTPVIEYLSSIPKEYRVLPLDGSDPMQFASNRIPVLFTSNAVQQRRWQEFLDAFVLNSAMPDIMNVKYLIHDPAKYASEKAMLGERFVPVFQSPDGSQIVLENRSVMPKAWLVPSVVPVSNASQLLGMIQSPVFDPRRMALVESPPPIPLSAPAQAVPFPAGSVRMLHYEGGRIAVAAANNAPALLVLGEKYYRGWKAFDNGRQTDIVPVDHVLRGVYLPPGNHNVEFVFNPWPFKVGKYLTFSSFAIFIGVAVWDRRRKAARVDG